MHVEIFNSKYMKIISGVQAYNEKTTSTHISLGYTVFTFVSHRNERLYGPPW